MDKLHEKGGIVIKTSGVPLHGQRIRGVIGREGSCRDGDGHPVRADGAARGATGSNEDSLARRREDCPGRIGHGNITTRTTAFPRGGAARTRTPTIGRATWKNGPAVDQNTHRTGRATTIRQPNWKKRRGVDQNGEQRGVGNAFLVFNRRRSEIRRVVVTNPHPFQLPTVPLVESQRGTLRGKNLGDKPSSGTHSAAPSSLEPPRGPTHARPTRERESGHPPEGPARRFPADRTRPEKTSHSASLILARAIVVAA
jgi:hypothetical protein